MSPVTRKKKKKYFLKVLISFYWGKLRFIKATCQRDVKRLVRFSPGLELPSVGADGFCLNCFIPDLMAIQEKLGLRILNMLPSPPEHLLNALSRFNKCLNLQGCVLLEHYVFMHSL